MKNCPFLKMPYLTSTTRQTLSGPWSHCMANTVLSQPTTSSWVLALLPCPHALALYHNLPLSPDRSRNPSIHPRNNSPIQLKRLAASCSKGPDLPMLGMLGVHLSSIHPKLPTRISPLHLFLNVQYQRPCHRPQHNTRRAPQSQKLRLQASWHLQTLRRLRQVVALSQRHLVDTICTTSMR